MIIYSLSLPLTLFLLCQASPLSEKARSTSKGMISRINSQVSGWGFFIFAFVFSCFVYNLDIKQVLSSFTSRPGYQELPMQMQTAEASLMGPIA